MVSIGVGMLTLMAMVWGATCEGSVEESRWTVVRGYVEPVVLSEGGRSTRSLEEDRGRRDVGTMLVTIANWTTRTVKNDRLVASPNLEIQWVGSEHSARNDLSELRHYGDCDVRQGHVVDDDESLVVLTICDDEFYVMLGVDDRVFYVRPAANGRHVLEEVKTLPVRGGPEPEVRFDADNYVGDDEDDEDFRRMKKLLEKSREYVALLSNVARTGSFNESTEFLDSAKLIAGEKKLARKKRKTASTCPPKGFYNLTGDTFELGNETKPTDVEADEEEPDDDEEGGRDPAKPDSDEEELAAEEDSEHIGYFFDRTWEKTKLPSEFEFYCCININTERKLCNLLYMHERYGIH